jgi:hypothetical protein
VLRPVDVKEFLKRSQTTKSGLHIINMVDNRDDDLSYPRIRQAEFGMPLLYGRKGILLT